MRETGKVAIARVVIRSKEQLVALRPIGDVLGMATMIFADEILPPERLDELAEAGEIKTTKRELDVAKQLVDSLAGDFEPSRYSDTYRERGARADRAQGPGRGDRRAACTRSPRSAGPRSDERVEGEPRRGARPRREGQRQQSAGESARQKGRGQETGREKNRRKLARCCQETRVLAHLGQALGAPPSAAGVG